ncbi:MAG: cell division protein FtsQ/DivIB [Buchnera aphidicola (Meitanaphis elongallis)]
MSNKKISSLTITGKFYYLNRKNIKDLILSLQKPCNFFSQYDTFIQHQLIKFPFIKTVIIKKKWPNKLFIHITGTIPIAYWNDKYILSDQGTIHNITKKKINISNIPHFYGSYNSKIEILNHYNIINNILKNNHIVLTSITVTHQHLWKLFVENHIEIILGRIKNITQLKKLVNIWKILKKEEKIKIKTIKYIDLRYESGIAIAWK